MKRNYKRWFIWLGLVISAVFLYLAFREIDYAKLWATFQDIHLWWILPGLVIFFGGKLVRAWRWQYLLKPLKKISIVSLFTTILIGYMGNNVFPLRVGEVMRAVVVKRRHQSPISGGLATIVVERMFDSVVVVGFVLLNLRHLASLPGAGRFSNLGGVALWAAVIFLFGLVIFILVAMFPKPAIRLTHGMINRILPQSVSARVIGISDKFLDGLMSLRSPKDAVMILLTSIIIWVMETGLFWGVNQALGFGLNYSQLMLMNGVVNMVLLIPAAPGGLGTFDAAGRAILEAYAISSEPALGYTLVLRVALWVPITLLGTFFFIQEGLKWTMDIEEMQAQALPEANEPKG